MRRIFNPVIISMLVLLVTCSNKPKTAVEILDLYFNAVSNGDVTKWDNLKLAYIESKVTHLEPEQPAMVYKEYSIFPNFQRLDEIKNDGSHIVSIYRDHTFFAAPPMDMPPGLPSVPPIVIPQSSPSFVFETVQVKQILEKSNATELVGLTNLDGKPAYEITFQLPAVVWRYYFDAENFTAVKAVQESKTTENKKVFSDYRNIDGLLIPMKIERWMRLGSITSHQLEIRTTVDLHPKIELNFFDVPKGWKD